MAADETITCRHCGHVCPIRMQSCPECFALLRLEDIDPDAALELSLSSGIPMGRPEGRAAFAAGPGCTLKRLAGRSGLVLLGEDGFVEAEVSPIDDLPVECVDEARSLFRLEPYDALPHAVVAMGADGAAIATFVPDGAALEVRDETSAPVARLEHDPDRGGYRLVETDGRVLALVDVVDDDQDGWVDDQWSLSVGDAVQPPLQELALVALVVAAKQAFGRPEPTPAPPRQ